MKIRISGPMLVGLGLVVVCVCILGVAWRKLPDELPWFYSLPKGEGQLASKNVFAGGVGAMGIVFLINQFIANRIGKEDKILGMTIAWFGVVVNVLYAATFIKVIDLMI